MQNKSDCKNPWLCTALGFFLPLLGLIVGAIIGKGDGVKHALGGIGLRYALIVGGCLWLFNSKPPESPVREASKPSESVKRKTWELWKDKSPLDDSTVYTVRREAESPVRGGFRKSPPVLILRSKEGKCEAYISWPLYISRDKLPVSVRFDSDEAVTEEWNCSTDGKAVFSPFPFQDFLDMVLNSKRLVVRLTPFGENPETATFDISGFADIIDTDTLEALKGGGN